MLISDRVIASKSYLIIHFIQTVYVGSTVLITNSFNLIQLQHFFLVV